MSGKKKCVVQRAVENLAERSILTSLTTQNFWGSSERAQALSDTIHNPLFSFILTTNSKGTTPCNSPSPI
jgi:hypothetical protein